MEDTLAQELTRPLIERKGQILIWTPEIDAYVMYWLDKRKTYTWISDELNVTRNAVIGRVYRNRKKK
jgi:hypothetical protein